MPTSAAAKAGEFAAVFAAFKRMLAPHEKGRRAVEPSPDYYYIETIEPINRGKPLYLAGVKRGKAYVSYYLMPLYGSPVLLKTISPDLKRRMQGKACFNFQTVDENLFAELAALTNRVIPKLIECVSKAPALPKKRPTHQ